VIGVHLPEEPEPPAGPRWSAADLRQPDVTRTLVRDVEPDCIVHLAAISFPPAAERDPLEALRVNYGAVDALLDGMARFAPRARLLYVGTGSAYGARPPDAPPFDEEDPLRPEEQRCVLAVEREGLCVVRVRPLNHTGPGRPLEYAESSIARQLARIERGEQPPVLRLGNLESIRDFSDVRDVVAAYELLLERGEPGAVYNVCSGQGCSIKELVERLVAMSRVTPRVEQDPSRYRPAKHESLALVGNPARLRSLGWEPRYTLDDTLLDLLEDWRSRA
jgi:GDP-4-dehydro-6-deoxy-D-mannose reductase